MLKKGLVVLVVLVLVAGFLAAKDWDSPELGQALLGKVSESTGVSMTARSFRLNLLHGLELEGVEGSTSSEGRDVSFTLEHLLFEHRLVPLLSGTVAVDRVVLESPVIELVEGEAGTGAGAPGGEEPASEPEAPPSDAPGGSAEGSGLALQVQQIRVEDGTLVMKKRGEEGETRIEGLDFTMSDLGVAQGASSLAGVFGAGELRIREVSFDDRKVTDAKSTFALKDGRFELSELSFTTKEGRFRADMDYDFNPVPFAYRLSATGEPVDVNVLLGTSEGFGPATVQLDAEGEGTASKDVAATGTIRLAGGEFPDDPMFSGVDKAVGKKAVVGSPYEPTEAKFRLENDRLTLEPFRFVSQDARLDLSGWVSLEGPLSLKLGLATPREGIQIEGIGSAALDVLADAEGWVPIPIDVSGTLQEPRVRPDTRQLASLAGQGAKRELTNRATESLQGLFNRKP